MADPLTSATTVDEVQATAAAPDAAEATSPAKSAGADEPVTLVDPNSFSRGLLVFLLACELAIVFLDATLNHLEWTQVGSIQRLVNITREDGISNWFASSQALLVSMVLGAIFLRVRAITPGRTARGWGLMTLFFLYISFDDGCKFHERVGTWYKVTAGRIADGGGPTIFQSMLDVFPSYTWQVVFLPFFAAAGLFVLVFLWKAFDASLRRFLVAALACFALAVGIDWIEGLDDGWGFVHRATNWQVHTIEHFGKAAEEFIEMFATSLFLTAFLRYLSRIGRGWRIGL